MKMAMMTAITVTMMVTEITDSKTVAVPITYRNIGQDLSLTDSTVTTVDVTIFGPINALKAYDSSRIGAYVDLNGYGEGIHNLPIRFSYDGAIAYLTFEPATETATVELIAEQTD